MEVVVTSAQLVLTVHQKRAQHTANAKVNTSAFA